MRRFACLLLTLPILGVSFGLSGCGGDPNPPGMPTKIESLDPEKADALKNQFMKTNTPKKKQ